MGASGAAKPSVGAISRCAGGGLEAFSYQSIIHKKRPAEHEFIPRATLFGRVLLQFDIGNDLCTDGMVQGLHELVASHVKFGAKHG